MTDSDLKLILSDTTFEKYSFPDEDINESFHKDVDYDFNFGFSETDGCCVIKKLEKKQEELKKRTELMLWSVVNELSFSLFLPILKT